MTKIGRPPRLIAYDTDINIKRRQEGKPAFVKIVRVRTRALRGDHRRVGGIMLYTLATRQDLSASAVIHDRNPMFVRLSDGRVRNGYTLRILNKKLQEREFTLSFRRSGRHQARGRRYAAARRRPP